MSVEVLAAAMGFAVDFDHEVSLAAHEVGDVAADDDLAAEGNAELAAAEGRPEALFGGCWVMPQVMSLGCELDLAVDDVARWMR